MGQTIATARAATLNLALTAGLSVTVGVGLAACGDPQALDETRHATGSTTLATSADYSAFYVVNADEESITRLSTAGAQAELDLPGRPTRVARAGGAVFVTLRGTRQLARLTDDGASLALDRTVELGSEPVGVVASEDGTRVYVASSLSNRVDELDATTLEVLRTWTVDDEPRWLALHPGGTLYVASAWQGTLTSIDLGSGDTDVRRLPERETFLFDSGEQVQMARRITGDPAVSPDGRFLAVPALYLDNQNPIATPDDPEGVVVDRGGGGYSADRFMPVVAVVELGGNGKPKLDDARLVTTNTFGERPITGYVSGVTIDPESAIVIANIEGADAAVAFPLEVPEPDRGSIFDGFLGDSDEFGGFDFEFRSSMVVSTPAGPRAVAFVGPDEAFVHGFLDRTVARFDTTLIRGFLAPSDGGAEDVEFFPSRGVGFGDGTTQSHSPMLATDRTLPETVEAGRRLFYSSSDSRMTQEGSGVSCALCHFDGRTDGLTWTFTTGARQTPSLAGQVSLTEPVRWEGDRPTVEDDAMFTSQGLMGGRDLEEASVDAIAAFIDWTPDVDSPLRGREDPAVARGREIFARADVGCARCHSGARYTDNRNYSMFGMPSVQTRSLVGLAGSPPYLHDGSAATLRDLLEMVRGGQMGNTGGLSDAEMGDLEAYLLSL